MTAKSATRGRTAKRLTIAICAVGCAGLLVLSFMGRPAGALAAPSPEAHEAAPPHWLLGSIPFAAILGAIAILPLLKWSHHWWESNLHRLLVAVAAASATIAYYVAVDGWNGAATTAGHALHEYVPFIILLGTLFVVTGGISIRADLRATPAVNTGILAFGTLIASVVGTTGASMLLIRLLLETNKERRRVVHSVVAFIFLVSNIGGTLLPIGDPPLFLGFLRGVPFLWTLRLWMEWAVMSGAVLALYFIYDTWQFRHERPRDLAADRTRIAPLRVRGWINVPWLAAAVICVACVKDHLLRDVLLVSISILSLVTTPRGVRRDNAFTWAPILEVAAIFLGIFVAMQVPLAALHEHGAQLGIERPWQFFWATGLLSSVLDNAPTYLVFLQTADSLTSSPGPGVLTLMGGNFIREDHLVAISLGAVFMGANTYIGNGPNFMVKAVAESSGVRMPSFFGYMIYSAIVLMPLYVVITFLFLA